MRKFSKIFNDPYSFDGNAVNPEDHARALLEMEIRKIDDDLDYVKQRVNKATEEIAKLEQEEIFLRVQRQQIEKALEKFE